MPEIEEISRRREAARAMGGSGDAAIHAKQVLSEEYATRCCCRPGTAPHFHDRVILSRSLMNRIT
jgi:hypothetical protein